MAKKVLILSSSPRRGGNSDTLCDEFMRGAAESNHEVEKIFLRDKTIHYCTGCSTCSLYQKPCPQKDDAAEIIEKMVDADVIVMATPVYFYTMSAQMKNPDRPLLWKIHGDERQGILFHRNGSRRRP